MINAVDRVPRRQVKVVGHGLSLAEAGDGPPVLFIHGNATYSYVWRNLIPYLTRTNRALAPDLPGMGRSEVVYPSGTNSYPFPDQLSQISLLVETQATDEPIVVVGHELGGTAAAHYARMNPDRVVGLVLIEGATRITNDAAFPSDVARFLADVRGNEGEHMVLKDNLIVERYLPRLTLRVLGPTEMDAYREPYRRVGESRRAMLSMIRQLPLMSMPGPIDDLAEDLRRWCSTSQVPKLVIGGNPGFLVPPHILGTTGRWTNTTTAAVRGSHFLMEDSPARLTAVILDWLHQIGHVA